MKQAQLPIDGTCQRWREGRASYRPAGEPLDPRRFDVEPLPTRAARDFVCTHHYSGSWPSSRLAVGLLYKRAFGPSSIVGVANFGEPLGRNAIEKWTGTQRGEGRDGAELNRFVLLDWVPANAESWFLAEAFRCLRAHKPAIEACIAYADPVAVRVGDALVKPGHVGTIYQASNAAYAGLSSPETYWVAASGQIVTRRLVSKLRNDEVGAAYAYRTLRRLGAPGRLPGESDWAWVTRVLDESGVFRRWRHPGKHVYAFGLGAKRQRQAMRQRVACGLAYPKANQYTTAGAGHG